MSALSDLCTHARKGRLFALTYEVYGGVHFGPLFDPEGTIAAHDRERKERIEAQGWEVLVVTDEDLRRENLPGTIAVIREFLDRKEPTR